MPGANCSIFGCLVSHRQKYKGVSLFKVPSGKTEFDAKWRNQLIAVITKDRVIDSSLREQIRRVIYMSANVTLQFYRHDKMDLWPSGVDLGRAGGSVAERSKVSNSTVVIRTPRSDISVEVTSQC